jgi:ABC-2 type transport system ATP-binding protein
MTTQPSTSNDPIIELQGLTKSYGSLQALKGVDLTVEQGALYGFLGPNGAGKTTSIRVMTGFIEPGEGTAKVFGLDAWKDSVAIKRRIGFLPDSPGMYGGLTGQEFLDYLGRLSGDTRPPLQRELLDRLELSGEALSRKLKGYSQGMKRKVAVVQAIQHDPELLIMDEPTDGLDPLMQQVFFELVREFTARGGTVFMSSHILPEVEELCGRVAIIRDGRVVTTGSVADLRDGRRRSMTVVFRGQPPEDLGAPGVEVVARDGANWQLSVSGDINPLLRELAGYDIEDMVFERPRLEELFMDYYRSEEPSGD